ncbi:MAG: thioredoxin family protein [Chlamydiae bacterium]|nr:MAG: thioredoxin family protein [Chlamydiota bacterium]
MKIQILGTGCPKCKQLAEITEKTAKEIGIDFQLEKITDLEQIMAFGVMMTPALAIDNEVKAMGKIPSADELKKILK